MTSTRSETIATPDGTFAAHLALPDAGRGPGLLVLQEIFGVNAYIRSVCERVARMGYVALAPDVFWRLTPGYVVEPDAGPAGLEDALATVARYDWGHAVDDLGAALAHLRGLPECGGRAGVLGFCFGGTLAFRLAAARALDCAVSYYGSDVGTLVGEGARAQGPILFHYGADDPYVPADRVAAVQAVYGNRVVVQPGAGHAFDNDHNPLFSDPDAAAAAWEVTAAFLAAHL